MLSASAIYRHVFVALSESYAKWIERMKIPPRIERDPLDLDYPTTLLGSSSDLEPEPVKRSPISFLNDYVEAGKGQQSATIAHPPGPMVDVNLLAQQAQNQAACEKAILKHFLVFDSRFGAEVGRVGSADGQLQ